MKEREYKLKNIAVAVIIIIATFVALASPLGTPTAVADAGDDQIVDINEEVQLDGSGSVGEGTLEYTWFLRDGTVLSGLEAQPKYTFKSEGVYEVGLMVKDSNGYYDLDTVQIRVKNYYPSADADSNIVANEDETVSFDASASSDINNDIVSYEWDFGDGVNANGISQSYIYQKAGVFYTTLTVTDNDGAFDKDIITVTVNNLEPTADGLANGEVDDDLTIYEDDIVSFDASPSTDTPSDMSLLEYSWDFGDGSKGVGIATTHTYTKQGVYVTTLTVKDDNDASTQDIITVNVLNSPPLANAGADRVVDEGSSLFLYGRGSSDTPSDEPLLQYSWDYETDGSYDDTGWYTKHTWWDDKAVETTLEVEDDDSAININSQNIIINNVAPQPSIYNYDTSLSTTVDFGLRIAGEKWHDVQLWMYENSSEIAYRQIIREPGSPNEQMEFVYDVEIYSYNTYEAKIVYTPEDDPPNGQVKGASPCWLILYLEDGNEFKFHRAFNYNKPTEWTWNINLSSIVRVDFEAEIFDPGMDTVTFNWDFGDTTPIISQTYLTTGSHPTKVVDAVMHLYVLPGTYTIALTAIDDEYGSSTYTLDLTNTPDAVTVNNLAPRAYTDADKFIAQEGEEFEFSGSEIDLLGEGYTYHWTFDDGSFGSGQDVTHSYNDEGVYLVILTVTDAEGESGKDYLFVTVTNIDPIADAGSSQIADEDDIIYFDASGTWDSFSDLPLLAYSWDFGDSSKGYGKTVDHVYTKEGIYTVTLAVQDNNGALSKDTISVSIGNPSPYDVTINAVRNADEDELIFFLGTAVDTPSDEPLLTYLWNFGDGTVRYGRNPTHSYSSVGEFLVNLTVTDDDLMKAYKEEKILVSNIDPIAYTGSSFQRIYGPAATIKFEGRGFDTYSDQSSLTYTWDLGGGVYEYNPTVTIEFSATDIYDISFKVADIHHSVSTTIQIRIDFTLDSDGDLLTDEEEVKIGTNQFNWDTDGDDLMDSWEVHDYPTDPLLEDSDHDGMNDWEEITYLGLTDPDDDGLLNPVDWDSDGDWIKDGDDTNPLIYNHGDGSLATPDEIITVNNEIGVSVIIKYEGDSTIKPTIELLIPPPPPLLSNSLGTYANIHTTSTDSYTAEVRFKYDEGKLPPEASESRLIIYHFISGKWKIERNGGVNEVANYVWTIVDEFSGFTVGDFGADNDYDGLTDGEESNAGQRTDKTINTFTDGTVEKEEWDLEFNNDGGSQTLYANIPMHDDSLEYINDADFLFDSRPPVWEIIEENGDGEIDSEETIVEGESWYGTNTAYFPFLSDSDMILMGIVVHVSSVYGHDWSITANIYLSECREESCPGGICYRVGPSELIGTWNPRWVIGDQVIILDNGIPLTSDSMYMLSFEGVGGGNNGYMNDLMIGVDESSDINFIILGGAVTKKPFGDLGLIRGDPWEIIEENGDGEIDGEDTIVEGESWYGTNTAYFPFLSDSDMVLMGIVVHVSSVYGSDWSITANIYLSECREESCPGGVCYRVFPGELIGSWHPRWVIGDQVIILDNGIPLTSDSMYMLSFEGVGGGNYGYMNDLMIGVDESSDINFNMPGGMVTTKPFGDIGLIRGDPWEIIEENGDGEIDREETIIQGESWYGTNAASFPFLSNSDMILVGIVVHVSSVYRGDSSITANVYLSECIKESCPGGVCYRVRSGELIGSWHPTWRPGDQVINLDNGVPLTGGSMYMLSFEGVGGGYFGYMNDLMIGVDESSDINFIMQGGTVTTKPFGDIGLITSYRTGLPGNPKIDVGDDGSIDWDYMHTVRATQTIEFEWEFRKYLGESWTQYEGHVQIPLVISAESSGVIQIKDINIDVKIIETDPYNMYSDADGWNDGDEIMIHGTDPTTPDTDSDGLYDDIESIHGTHPCDWDTDDDGMPDGWEVDYGLDPTDPNDAHDDIDVDEYNNPRPDGLTNLQEYEEGTNPLNWDTDDDKMPDGWEVRYNLNPNANDASVDIEPDGFTNLEEYQHNTHPRKSDTDDDGLTDVEEVLLYGTDPTDRDTDDDKGTDSDEVYWGRNPKKFNRLAFAISKSNGKLDREKSYYEHTIIQVIGSEFTLYSSEKAIFYISGYLPPGYYYMILYVKRTHDKTAVVNITNHDNDFKVVDFPIVIENDDTKYDYHYFPVGWLDIPRDKSDFYRITMENVGKTHFTFRNRTYDDGKYYDVPMVRRVNAQHGTVYSEEECDYCKTYFQARDSISVTYNLSVDWAIVEVPLLEYGRSRVPIGKDILRRYDLTVSSKLTTVISDPKDRLDNYYSFNSIGHYLDYFSVAGVVGSGTEREGSDIKMKNAKDWVFEGEENPYKDIVGGISAVTGAASLLLGACALTPCGIAAAITGVLSLVIGTFTDDWLKPPSENIEQIDEPLLIGQKGIFPLERTSGNMTFPVLLGVGESSDYIIVALVFVIQSKAKVYTNAGPKGEQVISAMKIIPIHLYKRP